MFFWCAHLVIEVGVFSYLRAAMKCRNLILVFLLFVGISLCAQGRYHPGDVVPKPYLKVFGFERFFEILPISEEQKALMQGCSFHDEKIVSWDELRYLRVLHSDAEGNAIVGEIVCNKVIAEDLLLIFKELFKAQYPIESILLIEHFRGDDEASMQANNTSCFNQRHIPIGGLMSKHSYGMAVDINPKYNPYYKVREGKTPLIRPEGSEIWLFRRESSPYLIRKGDLCYKLFKQKGFHWGGEWLSGKDYQHFEK